ncbi:MAG: hypothetical protein LUC48_05595 [Clostridiales bacterium]|nr:hypothetical protein [Clostridiales bacterium]
MSVLYKGEENSLKNLGFSRFCAFFPLTASISGIILLLCVAVSYWRSSRTALFSDKEKPLTAASCGEGFFFKEKAGKRMHINRSNPRPLAEAG